MDELKLYKIDNIRVRDLFRKENRKVSYNLNVRKYFHISFGYVLKSEQFEKCLVH